MNEVQTIDVTPNADGFRAMKTLSQESIATYEKELRDIANARTRVVSMQITARQRLKDEQMEIIHAGLDLLEAQVEGSLDVLRDTVRELERCGY